MEVKRRERKAILLFDQLLWAVPHDSEVFILRLEFEKIYNSSTLLVTAPEIVEFWRETLRTQFNARSGVLDVIEKGGFSAVLLPCAD